MNVVVITIDALRADMPWTGYPRDIAPRLAALEARSVSYRRAYALSSYTAASTGGLLAGRYPGELPRSGYFFSAYPEEVVFFPEVLGEHGVKRLAAHAHWYFDETAGFRSSFDDYRMVPGIKKDNETDNSITSPEHLALATAQLEAQAEGAPFFAWYHFMDPHDRYLNHEGYPDYGPRHRDRYDAEVRFTDHHVGQLLDVIAALPDADRTAIIVSADHGEAFGEKGMHRHAYELWEALVHVPLIVFVPGVEPRRIDVPRSHIDLAPTILELMAVPSDDRFVGQSLVPELRGEVDPTPRPVFVDLPRTSDSWRRRALVHGRHKLIAFGDERRFELYDVVEDPEERVNLRLKEPALFEDMKRRYLEGVQGIRDVCPKLRDGLQGRHPNKDC